MSTQRKWPGNSDMLPLDGDTLHLLHADEHIREGMRKLASDRGYHFHSFDSLESQQQGHEDQIPSCLIADFDMLGRERLPALFDSLGERASGCAVIFLYRLASPEDAKHGIRAGALAFVQEGGEWQELESYISVGMSLSRITSQNRTQSWQPEALGSVLSGRELEVLQLVALGLSSRQIADSLKISTRTVESHRGNMLKKLSLGSTAELLRHYYYYLNSQRLQ